MPTWPDWRANSAPPPGDPGVPHDEALAAVVHWHRSRGLPPMIAVLMPLDGAWLARYRARYERRGFRYSHRYHYRIAPAQPRSL